jgi:hypothetical protein
MFWSKFSPFAARVAFPAACVIFRALQLDLDLELATGIGEAASAASVLTSSGASCNTNRGLSISTASTESSPSSHSYPPQTLAGRQHLMNKLPLLSSSLSPLPSLLVDRAPSCSGGDGSETGENRRARSTVYAIISCLLFEAANIV